MDTPIHLIEFWSLTQRINGQRRIDYFYRNWWATFRIGKFSMKATKQLLALKKILARHFSSTPRNIDTIHCCVTATLAVQWRVKLLPKFRNENLLHSNFCLLRYSNSDGERYFENRENDIDYEKLASMIRSELVGQIIACENECHTGWLSFQMMQKEDGSPIYTNASKRTREVLFHKLWPNWTS